jgi:hypothetical protein
MNTAIDDAKGLVQVVPTSIVKGASGTASVSTGGAVTFSGTESIALNDVFSSTYQNYYILVVVSGSTSLNVNSRLRLSGTDASDTTYASQGLTASATSVSGARVTSQTSINLGEASTSDSSTMVVTTFRPNLAVPTLFNTNFLRNATSNLPAIHFGVGMHVNSTAYDGITFIASTGNITGNIRVYGYKNG